MGYDSKSSFLSKVVIRKLPPKLTEEQFRSIVSPMPPHSEFRFCGVDDSLGNLGLARAYINFTDLDMLFDFKERYDNYVFVDNEGNESCAQIEFAVCQSLANLKDSGGNNKYAKADRKQGTIQEDPEFMNFIKTLEQNETAPEVSDTATKKMPWEEILDEIQNKETNLQQTKVITPLLTYINKKDADSQRDEMPMRHYKQKRNKGLESTAKIEKPVHVHNTSRRQQDPKRSIVDHITPGQPSRGQNKEDSNFSVPTKFQKPSKDTILDADEFPAMQGAVHCPAKPTGSWSERPSVWQTTSEVSGSTSVKKALGSSKTKGNLPTEHSVGSNQPSSALGQPKNSETNRTITDDLSRTSITSTSSDPHYTDGNSVRESVQKSKRGYYSPRVTSNSTGHNRKTIPNSPYGRRDYEGKQSTSHLDDQDSEYASDYYNSHPKHAFRGRRGSATDEIYTRDSYRSSQQMSKDNRPIRGYDYTGDGTWDDRHNSSRQNTSRGSSRGSRGSAASINRSRHQGVYDSRN